MDLATPGSTPVRYDNLDCIDRVACVAGHPTEILLVNSCCKKVARHLGSSVGLLCSGAASLRSWGSIHKGQLGLVTRTTALMTLWPDSMLHGPAPRWGGIYILDVLVYKDSEGSKIEPTSVSMVYVCTGG
jgi:hypothetical protein